MPPEKLNLNVASAEELAEVLGVNLTLANRVIKLRDARGGFNDVDELEEVYGISTGIRDRARGVLHVAKKGEATEPSRRLVLTVVPEPPLSQEKARTLPLRISYRARTDGERVSERHPVALHETTQIEIDPFPAIKQIQVTLEDHQGLALLPEIDVELQHQQRHVAASQTLIGRAALPTDEFGPALERRQPTTTDTLDRGGRFVVMGCPERRFDCYQLAVDVIDTAEKARAVHRLFESGSERAPATATRQLDTDDTGMVEKLAGFDLAGATLKYDGKFSFSRPLPPADAERSVRGWLWWLNGPVPYVGYRREEVPRQAQDDLTIVLTGEVTPEANTGRTAGTRRAKGNCCGGGDGDSPMDVDEEQLLREPDRFNDDPGSFCKPFDNPARILGERSFKTVLRVEQPEIASTSPNRPYYPLLLPDEPQTHRIAQPKGVSANLRRFFARPQPGLSSLSLFPLPVPPRPSRRPADSRNPIDWDGDPTRHQALSVAGGHILEWRVQWRSNGYSLGDVQRTLTLAPRQTRRVVKVDWARSERARRDELTQSSDEFEHGMDRRMDYTTAVSSGLREWSRGHSESQQSGAAGGLGFASGGFVIGGGASHGRASSDSWQRGGRDVSASEEQQLRDSIRQYGDSLRQLESTVVTEAQQHEAVEGVSEVIRNPNYCHSLSVLYYEILRHLRVDTTLGGVRECLFVPFAITPFTHERLLRWRDPLQRRLQRRELRWALEHAEKMVAVEEATTDSEREAAWGEIPAGPRASHDLRYLSGSMYIKLGIERPESGSYADEIEEGATEDRVREIREAFKPFSGLLSEPVEEVAKRLVTADEAAMDDYFRREVAPVMARNWVENLRLFVDEDTELEGVDFTLASTYHHGGTLRIDYTVPLSVLEDNDVNRQKLVHTVLKSGESLPPRSLAQCWHGQFTYETEHDRGRARSDRRARNLVKAESGEPGGEQASLYFSLTSYEQQNMRDEIRKAYEQILDHVNRNLHFYHKVIWWHMDRDELYTILDGYAVSSNDGRSIASVVERQPVGILGNSLVFPVAAGAFLGVDGHESPDEMFAYYHDSGRARQPMRVSLPTDGVYAQALMDECHACEEHHGSTDWVLDDEDPELAKLPAELLRSRRSEPRDLQPSEFPQPIITQQNAPQTPQTQGLDSALSAVQQSGAFRDMAGLEGTQQSARAAMQQASQLANTFGGHAKELELDRRRQESERLDRDMASLEKWGERHGLSEEDRRDLARKRLESTMDANASANGRRRNVDESASEAARSLAPGQTATASRIDETGAETVSVGYNTPPSSGSEGRQHTVPEQLTRTEDVELDWSASLVGKDPRERDLGMPVWLFERAWLELRARWIRQNIPRRGRFQQEPATNLDGLPIPDWVDADRVFEQLREHYQTQHAELTDDERDNQNYTREPEMILGPDTSAAVDAQYFVVHDTAYQGNPTVANIGDGVHCWIGPVSIARDRDWSDSGQATRLEHENNTCFLHVELYRACAEDDLSEAAEDDRDSDHLSTARQAGTYYTDQQYDDLANAYIVASLRRGRLLTVTGHLEVDRSIQGAHRDPIAFDVAYFYERIAKKLMLPTVATFGIEGHRLLDDDEGMNEAGDGNVFIPYVRGEVPAAPQYGPVRSPDEDPILSAHDTADGYYTPPVASSIACGNGRWEQGPDDRRPDARDTDTILV